MPDKQNDNKFMAMLERKGIVRKAGSDDDQIETDSAAAQTLNDSDLRYLIDPPNDEPAKVTPAARQPIPGLSNPIIPGDKPQQTQHPSYPDGEEAGQPTVRLEREYAVTAELSENERSFPENTGALDESQKPTRAFGGITGTEPFSDDDSAIGGLAVAPAEQVARTPEPPIAENYADRYLDIDELYEVLSLKSKRTDTIYLIEEYIKTLPESLPDASRREIIGKIIAASGFDYDLLMGDGILRVKMLKEYAERFARYTDEYVAARNAELNELEQQSLRIRRLIENRRDLHKKQFFAIEAEAQRLKDILTFISG